MSTPPNSPIVRSLTRLALVAACALPLAACGEADETAAGPDFQVQGQLRSADQLVVCGAASGVPCDSGWVGAYYDNREYQDLFDVRVDSEINFNWGNGAPISGMGSNTFSIAWFGYLTPTETDQYRFWVNSDDGLQLAIDGQMVVDDLSSGGHGMRWVSGDWITLEAGRTYAMFAEAREDHGGAGAQLFWQRSGQADNERTVVPGSLMSLVGGGSGLQLAWFDTADAMNSDADPVHTEVVADIDFDLDGTAPAGITDGYAARATGFVEPLYPGTYTFEATCSGGARMTVSGASTGNFDRSGALGTYTETFTVDLAVGERGRVVLEMFDTDPAVTPGCAVSWSNPWMGDGSSLYPLPDSALFPATFGRGTGLEGKYFDNSDGTNLLSTQVDPAIDFDWGNQPPTLVTGEAMGTNHWRIDWTGELEPVTTGDYTFYGVADDRLEFWIATSWAPRAGGAACGQDRDCGWGSRCVASVCEDPVYVQQFTGNNVQSTVSLEEGVRYPVRVTHIEGSGNARARLEWSGPNLPRETVPSTQLYPPTRYAADGLGLEAHYFPFRFSAPLGFQFDPDTSNASVVRTDAMVNFDWGNGSPAPEAGFPSNNFMVRWIGQVRPRYTETYTFRTFTDDGIRLWVNGELLIDNWSYAGEQTGEIDLIAGKRYDIHMAYYEGGGGARARLLWESDSQAEEHIPQSRLYPPPRLGAGTGMLGEYFGDDRVHEDDLRLVRIDPSMDFAYTGGPVDVVPAGPHAVRWRGSIEPLYDETYDITVRSNGGARIYIGEQLVAESWADGGDDLVDVTTSVELLTNQLTDITIEYFQLDNDASVELLWESASQVESLIPTRQMYPAEPTSRVAFGQCRSVLSIESFDDGTLPDSLQEPPDDGLQLTGGSESRPDLWVANTGGRSLTRIDTSNGNVLATYPAGKDASRTAVDLDYNAWVANRAFDETGSLTKVLSVHADGTSCECCSEYNPDGTCAYYNPLDQCGQCVAYTIEFENNSLPRGLAVDRNNNVWVGLYNSTAIVEVANCPVDPETGVVDYDCANPICAPDDQQCIDRATEIGNDCTGTLPNNDCRGDQQLARYTQSGMNPYGLAIDQRGYIWAADWDGTYCFDTNTREFCGRYRRQWARDAGNGCDSTYGIAVDGDGNVWWGNYNCDGGLTRMDREVWDRAVDDNTDENGSVDWDEVEDYVNHHGTYQFLHPNGERSRGVAVDGEGLIWLVSSGTNRVLQFDPSLPAPQERIDENATCLATCDNAGGTTEQIEACYADCGPVPDGDFIASFPTCNGPIGVGISDEGDAWVVCRNDQVAQAFARDGTMRFQSSTGNSPYSYSDMTGFQLRNFTAPQGKWSRVFDCTEDGGSVDENGRCVFDYLTWDSVTPPGAEVIVRVRAGDPDEDGDIVWGEWSAEYAVTPAPLGRDGYEGRYVEVEVVLVAAPRGASPVLHGVQLWQCPQLYPPIDFDVEDRWIVDQSANDYGISWQFTDDSWPEEYFQMVDDEGYARCQTISQSSYEKGDRYSADGDFAGCQETGHISNTPITRWPQTVNRYNGEWLFSELGEPVTYYTLTNNPVADVDVRAVYRETDLITINWCKPQRNWLGGMTGARVERSLSPAFTPESTTVLADFPQQASATLAERGYADPDAFCGSFDDTGLEPGTMYYYRLTYQNGDGVPSESAVVSLETYGDLCCEDLGNCEGVCAFTATTGDGSPGDEVCEEPPEFEGDEETCDGLDNDCDGETDEGLLNACGGCGPEPVEICDGLDNDCNGIADDNPTDGAFYYRDRDGDTWGDGSDVIRACAPPAGYVGRPGDCNDDDAAINPDAEELCDGIDNDCDGAIDEDGDAVEFYADTDGDGFGDPMSPTLACAPPDGFVDDDTDCDDTEITTYPGAPELCDGVDNDCDGATDEGYSLYEFALDEVTTVAEVGADACSNAYDGPECAGAAAVVFTVTNNGDTPIAASTPVRLTMDDRTGAELLDGTAIGTAVAPGTSEQFTFCFGHGQDVAPEDERSVVGVIDIDSALGCGLDSGEVEDVTLFGGDEICDGVDNDCDGLVDEAPDACGELMICVENDREEGDDFLCVFRLTDESSDCVDGTCPDGLACDPTGACVYDCTADTDCGDNAECHQGACVSSAWIDDAAATTADDAGAPEVPADAAPVAPATADEPAQAGCASASSSIPSSAGWAGWLFGLLLLRRRRCRDARSGETPDNRS